MIKSYLVLFLLLTACRFTLNGSTSDTIKKDIYCLKDVSLKVVSGLGEVYIADKLQKTLQNAQIGVDKSFYCMNVVDRVCLDDNARTRFLAIEPQKGVTNHEECKALNFGENEEKIRSGKIMFLPFRSKVMEIKGKNIGLLSNRSEIFGSSSFVLESLCSYPEDRADKPCDVKVSELNDRALSLVETERPDHLFYDSKNILSKSFDPNF